MNNDGHIDLICAETEGLVVYMNDGNGVFTPNYYSQIAEIGLLVEAFDVDNDNDIDVVMTNNSNDTKLFINDGNGSLTFSHILSAFPALKSISSIDFNSDGLKDLYVSYTNTISVFLNDSLQQFDTEVDIYHDTTLIMGYICTGEIDNQNGEDIIWSGGNKKLAYHLNENSANLTSNFKDFPPIIYPNPVMDRINLSSELAVKQSKIYGVNGRYKLQSKQHSIDVQNLPKGSYFIIIETDNRSYYHRFIKN